MVEPHVRLSRTFDMHQPTAPSRAETRRKGLLSATASIALCFAAAPVFAQEQTPPTTEMTELEWKLLEKSIDGRANQIANREQFFETDRRPITVVATLDRASNVLFLDIDVSFGNDVGDLPLEDFQSAIRVGMEDLTGLIPGFHTTMWRIGGRDMDYWFEQQLAGSGLIERPTMAVARRGNERPQIVVAAGH